MTQSAVRELTDRVNASLDRSRSELLDYAHQNRAALRKELDANNEAVIKTESGARLRVRRDRAGRLRVA